MAVVSSRRKQEFSGAGAFTLLEVLTAMGVFCFAVLGLLFALNTAADASREAQEQKRIRAQVENRLARLSVPPLKAFAANEEADGVRFSEEIRPEPVKSADLSLLPGYWRVRVLAEWKEGGRLQQWDVSHLVWKP